MKMTNFYMKLKVIFLNNLMNPTSQSFARKEGEEPCEHNYEMTI